jgi:hypothetical protein
MVSSKASGVACEGSPVPKAQLKAVKSGSCLMITDASPICPFIYAGKFVCETSGKFSIIIRILVRFGDYFNHGSTSLAESILLFEFLE